MTERVGVLIASQSEAAAILTNGVMIDELGLEFWNELLFDADEYKKLEHWWIRVVVDVE